MNSWRKGPSLSCIPYNSVLCGFDHRSLGTEGNEWWEPVCRIVLTHMNMVFFIIYPVRRRCTFSPLQSSLPVGIMPHAGFSMLKIWLLMSQGRRRGLQGLRYHRIPGAGVKEELRGFLACVRLEVDARCLLMWGWEKFWPPSFQSV